MDATAEEGWWYEGGGIYRNVWFNKDDLIGFVYPGGLYYPTNVTLINADGTGTGGLTVNATIQNRYAFDKMVNVQFHVVDRHNVKRETLSVNSLLVKSMSTVTIAPSTMLEHVELWSPDDPALYALEAIILDETNVEISTRSRPFGFRQVVFDPDKGLILNGKPTKMYFVLFVISLIILHFLFLYTQ